MKDETKVIFKKTPEEIELESADLVRRRYNSLAEAALELEKENKILKAEVETCYAKMENAQKNVEINKTIVMNTIMSQNNMKNDFINEINILKAKLKKAQEALD